MSAEYEFEIWQDGAPVASAACGDRDKAAKEAQLYAAVFGQDGPVEVFEVVRYPICTGANNFAQCRFKATDRLDACHEPGGCLHQLAAENHKAGTE